MRNLKEDLKSVVNDVIYYGDIKDIILILREKFSLQDYINKNTPVEFNDEKFRGESFENAIDYDQFSKTLIVNMSVLKNKITTQYNNFLQPYNWMIVMYEILYVFEEIKLLKYQNEKIKNHVTKIIEVFNDFNTELTDASNYNFLKNYKLNETTKNQEIVNPVERIKMMHAYFNTLSIFEKILSTNAPIKDFKQLFDQEILKGYAINNQNIYPLRNLFFQNSYIDGQIFMNRFSWYDNEAMVALSNASKEVRDVKERLALGYPIDSIEYTLVRKNRV